MHHPHKERPWSCSLCATQKFDELHYRNRYTQALLGTGLGRSSPQCLKTAIPLHTHFLSITALINKTKKSSSTLCRVEWEALYQLTKADCAVPQFHCFSQYNLAAFHSPASFIRSAPANQAMKHSMHLSSLWHDCKHDPWVRVAQIQPKGLFSLVPFCEHPFISDSSESQNSHYSFPPGCFYAILANWTSS